MAYEFKYRLNSAPEARTDGSGMIAHELWMISVYQWVGFHKKISKNIT